MTARRHVVASPGGGWDVKQPGADRVLGHADTQQDAAEAARAMVQAAGGGEVRIHDRDGRIRDTDTVLATKAKGSE